MLLEAAEASTSGDHGRAIHSPRLRGIPESDVSVRPGVHIDEILRAQDGVITRRQAGDAGLTRAQIEHRLASRTWARVGCSVYRSAAHPESDRSRLRAHALGLGPDATLIGVGAAWWLRMTDEAPARFRFAVPGWRRVRGSDGLGVLRRDLDEDEHMLVDGIRTTTRAVTVLADVTITLPGYGEALLDLAFRAERIVVEDEKSTPIGVGRTTATPTTSGATATARTRSCSPAGPSSG